MKKTKLDPKHPMHALMLALMEKGGTVELKPECSSLIEAVKQGK